MKSVDKEIPSGFIEEMNLLLGEESSALIEAIDSLPSVSIRFNRKKVSDPQRTLSRFAGFGPMEVEWCGSGFYLKSRPDFILDPLLHAGVYYVQEAASMVYESVMESILSEPSMQHPAPLKVLDLCGAPGGKTTAMLNVLSHHDSDYVMVANEYERSRAGILRENLNKWGDPNVVVTSTSAASLGSIEGFFDIVAVDAPCSGEGMMRREPVARTQWSPRLVEQCSLLQQQILTDILPALKPGGWLIYSTCTFNSVENEENCRFLTEKCGLVPAGDPRRFMPHRQRCEGLFVAVFQRPEDDGSQRFKTGKPAKSKSFVKAPEKDIFLSGRHDLVFAAIGDRIFALPKSVAEVFALLESHKIKPLSAGVEAGTMKGKLFIPSSRQVLSYLFDAGEIPVVELDREKAIDYIRRLPVVLPADTPRGYVAVSHEGHPLGLVKNIGNRSNNLFPQEWRVMK